LFLRFVYIMSKLSTRILEWYSRHGRVLPWRDNPDPYSVWVSEIMLQQTRVETVIPYFERWMDRFPVVEKLAAATEQEVLSQWEGLGYYSRARNLYKAAGMIVEKYGGRLPDDLIELRKLPGVGKYTVGAIASMAFGVDAPTLDANVRRVFSRVFNIVEPADSTQGEKILWGLAEKNLPKGRAGDYNQALMDLGATICIPHNPDCQHCPLENICLARTLGIQELRPVLKPKYTIPHFIVTAAVIKRNGKILLAKRPSRGLLGGMWEFPGGKVEEGETLEQCLSREICEELAVDIRVGNSMGIYRHAYTHFKITLHAFDCKLIRGEPRAVEVAELVWVFPAELYKYPMGKVDRQISKYLQMET
jgi:A/G-specific adenine glycosylase